MRLIMIAFVMIFASGVATADNNQVMKQCLDLYGYKLENFDTFDFRPAAKCASDYRVNQNRIWLEKVREDIRNNPTLRIPGAYPYGHVSPSWGRNRIY